ncbi:MAG: hypothetical protein HY721_23950 [Planctomycetes bacterium]|nr:hypothetical protein [Planctomycetota bacterium]
MSCTPTGPSSPTPVLLPRREILRILGAGAAAVALRGAPLPAFAGPFQASDLEVLIPADKKLDPAWVRSLFDRGTPAVYRGAELEKIGMPIGGICTGQLYLGGDGKLWHWDIFNVPSRGDFFLYQGPHYMQPRVQASPIEQGFALVLTAGGKRRVRPLDRRGFSRIAFRGDYPMASVEYSDHGDGGGDGGTGDAGAVPVTVRLEAFSPFIPLHAEDSGLPATLMRYTVRNTGAERLDLEVVGWLENAACLETGKPGEGSRQNRVARSGRCVLVESSAAEAPRLQVERPPRPPVLVEDFERPAYEGWTATGTTFGKGPIVKAEMPRYQGDVGSRGERLVNSHNTRQGEDVVRGDTHTGTLTSRELTIERSYNNFLIGGGAHEGKTCVNLLVDGKVVRSAAGRNDNRMQPHTFDVRSLEGQTARSQVVDEVAGGWGNIGVDHIELSDEPAVRPLAFEERPDAGTTALAILEPLAEDRAAADLGGAPLEALAGGPLPAGRERPRSPSASASSAPPAARCASSPAGRRR